MKLVIIIYSILFLSHLAWADYPYEMLDSSYVDSGTVKEIFPSTPVKSQDGIGLCYGFAATSLLEHYRCKELNLSCSDSKDILSSLDISSYESFGEKVLKEGGMPLFILHNISNSNRKLAREECAPFSSLVHEIDYENNKYRSEEIGWMYLSQGWNNVRSRLNVEKSNDCITCLADSIKATLVNLKTPAEQITEALKNSKQLEEFLYKAILPAHCLQDDEALEIPKFNVKSFPTFQDPQGIAPLTNKIISLLDSNTPLQINICTEKRTTGDCGAHATTLFGIKEVCSKIKNECKKMVKVKNSYGSTWQKQNNNGWVDLQTLIDSSMDYSKGNNIVWIEKPASTQTTALNTK